MVTVKAGLWPHIQSLLQLALNTITAKAGLTHKQCYNWPQKQSLLQLASHKISAYLFVRIVLVAIRNKNVSEVKNEKVNGRKFDEIKL